MFDSWVGALNADDYREFALPHTRKIFAAIDGRVPTIHFGVATGSILHVMREAGGDVIGADWRIPLDEAWERIGDDRGIQGNLDPTLLLGPRDRLLGGARDVLRARRRPSRTHLQSRSRHPAVDAGGERRRPLRAVPQLNRSGHDGIGQRDRDAGLGCTALRSRSR